MYPSVPQARPGSAVQVCRTRISGTSHLIGPHVLDGSVGEGKLHWKTAGHRADIDSDL